MFIFPYLANKTLKKIDGKFLGKNYYKKFTIIVEEIILFGITDKFLFQVRKACPHCEKEFAMSNLSRHIRQVDIH